ncbi:MAG: choice-of-anchor W domain-containing protein [Cyanobacteria bacterium P01_A01_bin.45]
MTKVNKCKLFFAASLTAFGFCAVSNSANAFTLVDRSDFTDTDFRDAINNDEFSELFVAEGRIGNNQFNGDRELGINTAKGVPVAQGQFTWGNSSVYNFVLEYTGSKVNYFLDGNLLSSEDFSGSVTDIFFRTRAATDSQISLSDLTFNSTQIGKLSSQGTNGSDVDYLQISNISSSFTITGLASLSWNVNKPNNSQLAYQIKVGTSPIKSVPEPATISAVLLAGLAGLGLGKKSQKKK